jgi:hypothetical protein
MLYTQGFGSRPENVEVPVIQSRAPATTDNQFPVGKSWIDSVNNASYVLTSLSSSGGVLSANWVGSGGGSIELSSLTGDSGTATPSGGNIKIAGTANQIVTSASGSTVTLALTGPYTPATYTAHGVLLGEGTSSIVATAAGSAGQILTSGGASADPSWTTATFPTTATAGDLIAATATNVIGRIADVAVGQVLASGGVGVIPAYTGSPSVSGSVTAGTGLTATTGDLTISSGNANVTGNIVASKSSAGANVTVQATNSDNTSGTSNAGVEIASGGSSGGDPYLSFQISGVGASTMTMGLDNSVSDTFVISNSSSLGTSNALTLTQAGALNATTSITAGTTITATSGAITATSGDFIATNGNLQLQTLGNKIEIKAGTTGFCGTGTLSSGTVTINNTNIATGDIILLTRIAANGSTTFGILSYTISNGVSFTVTSLILGTPGSTQTADTSTFAYLIIRPL